MKKIIFFLTVLATAFIVSGCASYAWVQTPKGLALMRMEAGTSRSAEREAPAQRANEIDLGRTEQPQHRQPVGPMAMAVVPHMGTCGSGRTLEVRNETHNHYLEVRHTDLQVCDPDGLVPIAVQQQNGGIRQALVIPPGEKASFYFIAHRQVGGYPISTNGWKEYTVDVYDASSPILGYGATPAAHVNRIEHSVPIPYTCERHGCIRTDRITSFQVRWARL